jgi:hypothetical protein
VAFVTAMSAAVNPVTLSLKVIVSGMGDTFVVVAAVDANVTVGAALSNVRLNCVAAELPLPAVSVAVPAAMLAVTNPFIGLLRLNVYVDAFTVVKFATVAFVATTSAVTNPVTFSLKVTVTAIGEVPVGSNALEPILTVGTVESNVRENTLEVALKLFPASVAAEAAIWAVTRPSEVGVRLNV